MYSFIVPTCIKNNKHLNQLKRCIYSILQYHPESYIYLIDDSDDEFKKYVSLYTHDLENIKIIETKLKGSADQQVFSVILENNDESSHYIIIQDSMILNKKLDNIDSIHNVKFMWHFTNHIIDWDKIIEPRTSDNIINEIITHTDLIKYHLINNYNQDINFLNYCLNLLKNKHLWVGCFGNCCIVKRESIKYLDDMTKFSEKFVKNTSNRERRMNESIFSLICHYYIPQDYSNSYDGLYYDGINVNPFKNKVTEFDNSLVYCCKNTYLSKLSFER